MEITSNLIPRLNVVCTSVSYTGKRSLFGSGFKTLSLPQSCDNNTLAWTYSGRGSISDVACIQRNEISVRQFTCMISTECHGYTKWRTMVEWGNIIQCIKDTAIVYTWKRWQPYLAMLLSLKLNSRISMKTMLVCTSIRKLCQTFILTNRIHEITILLKIYNLQPGHGIAKYPPDARDGLLLWV